MDLDRLRATLFALPELAALPPLRELIGRVGRSKQIPCWDYPGLAAAALGGRPEQTEAASVAIFASLAAIHLVDDMLDEDPDGAHHQLGAGVVANFALLLQGAAHRVIGDAKLEPATAAAMQARLAAMTMATSLAQHFDTQPCADEAAYFRVIDSKTPPLFGCALALGALHAGAGPAQVDGVAALALDFGRMIQVSDDLKDAFERPAKPDWRRPTNNLALLYASVAAHEQREHFVELCARVGRGDVDALPAAHALLWRSGAPAYCMHHMIAARRRVLAQLDALALPNPAPLVDLLHSPIEPLLHLLADAGVEAPERLLGAA
jgi:geranylgeranyl diphosphate synthase type I